MLVLSRPEVVAWCKAHDVAVDHRDLPDCSDADFKFEIPRDAQKRVYLVGQAMKGFRDERLLLVWFDDWSVWPSGQRMHVFDRFRISYGESRALIDAPAHVFQGTEFEDAASFVTIAALFLWDCYVVTPRSTKLFYLSHDEYGVAKGVDLPGW